jgi:hypothetical protein
LKTHGLTTLVATLAGFGMLLAPASSRANECVDAAKVELRDCKVECKEDFRVAKDACVNRDHDCVQACRADREDCRTASGIADALAACDARLQIDKQNCRDQYSAGSPARDQCIDQAQIVAFQCRDSAREDARPALKQCRRDFRVCARACPPGDGPVVDRRQCRIEAKVAYRACKAECREDFQVVKDACRNRDHECVEQCRADRRSCARPILDQLEADIAACNVIRDGAIQVCKDLYLEDDPLRDQCIDNAQVAAFVCRDEARERARPDLRECRLQFRGCVRACPPAAG